MKTTGFVSVLLIGLMNNGMAQNMLVAPNEEVALQSCQEQALASPSELQDQMLSSCRCIVEHIDVKEAQKLNQAGETEALQTLFEQASEACSKQ